MSARGDNVKKIYVCSRLAGDIENNIEKAKGYARFVAKECGAVPIAPHMFSNTKRVWATTISKENPIRFPDLNLRMKQYSL